MLVVGYDCSLAGGRAGGGVEAAELLVCKAGGGYGVRVSKRGGRGGGMKGVGWGKGRRGK